MGLIKSATKEAQKMQYIFLKNILNMRIGLQYETELDDDNIGHATNIYLSELLKSFADSSFIEESKKYVKQTDMELAELVEGESARFKYKAYKNNAEYLMFHFTFGHIDLDKQKSSKWFEWNPRQKKGLCKSYYSFASSYAERLPKGRMISKIFDHISDSIDEYIELIKESKKACESKIIVLKNCVGNEKSFLLDEFIIKYQKFRQEPTRKKAMELEKYINLLKSLTDLKLDKAEEKIKKYLPKIISLDDL